MKHENRDIEQLVFKFSTFAAVTGIAGSWQWLTVQQRPDVAVAILLLSVVLILFRVIY